MLKMWPLVKLDAFCSLPRLCEALEPLNGLPVHGIDLIFMQCLETTNRRSECCIARKRMFRKTKRSGKK